MDFSVDELTRDRFLGGQLQIWQPQSGYRAGIDPVLLAASVPAKKGQTVLELGCGVGVASLCLACRVAGLHLTGVEIQPDYAELARLNAAENKIPMPIITADLCRLPPEILQQRFDHVIANPPYFIGARRTAAKDCGRETALAGGAPLEDWISAASRRLAPGGRLTVIQNAARLPDLLEACTGRVGSLVVTPLAPRIGRAANLIVLQARKGGKAAFRLSAPIIMHQGDVHDADRESYSPLLKDVLRKGAPLFSTQD